jgi:hypothetical protein
MRRFGASFALVLLCACTSMPEGATPSRLIDTHWMRVDDENASPHFPTLAFGKNDASGFLPGCEGWSAQVANRGAELTFVSLRPARLTCGTESATGVAARSFMRVLAATRSARVSENGQMELFNARGGLIARFDAN